MRSDLVVVFPPAFNQFAALAAFVKSHYAYAVVAYVTVSSLIDTGNVIAAISHEAQSFTLGLSGADRFLPAQGALDLMAS